MMKALQILILFVCAHVLSLGSCAHCQPTGVSYGSLQGSNGMIGLRFWRLPLSRQGVGYADSTLNPEMECSEYRPNEAEQILTAQIYDAPNRLPEIAAKLQTEGMGSASETSVWATGAGIRYRGSVSDILCNPWTSHEISNQRGIRLDWGKRRPLIPIGSGSLKYQPLACSMVSIG